MYFFDFFSSCLRKRALVQLHELIGPNESLASVFRCESSESHDISITHQQLKSIWAEYQTWHDAHKQTFDQRLQRVITKCEEEGDSDLENLLRGALNMSQDMGIEDLKEHIHSKIAYLNTLGSDMSFFKSELKKEDSFAQIKRFHNDMSALGNDVFIREQKESNENKKYNYIASMFRSIVVNRAVDYGCTHITQHYEQYLPDCVTYTINSLPMMVFFSGITSNASFYPDVIKNLTTAKTKTARAVANAGYVAFECYQYYNLFGFAKSLATGVGGWLMGSASDLTTQPVMTNHTSLSNLTSPYAPYMLADTCPNMDSVTTLKLSH